MARLEAMLDEPVVIFVATRDDTLEPHVARAWGGRLDAAKGSLKLAVTVHDDDRVVADLRANGQVSVLVGRPSNYKTMQVTGRVERIGPTGPDDLERIKLHIDRIRAEAVLLGLPNLVASLAGDKWVAIRVAPERFFEQTPGPRAGGEL